MRILLHICCGPCAVTVIQALQEAGHEVTGWFYNPNIQPLAEYLRRMEGAVRVAGRLDVPVIWPEEKEEEASPAAWLRMISGREDARCAPCWSLRLDKTARLAKERGFDAFTTSLLYSRRQDHEGIRTAGDAAAVAGVPFFYRDFREFWQRGIDLSKDWGIYRQQYCGCIFSEYERYARDLEKARAAR